jgi:PAS domain S-box-containing protein
VTHILIAEDSPTQAQHLRFILESEHFQVTHAASGEEALQLVEEHKYDLLISDIVMTGITGYELCSQLKSNRSTRDLPIILLTSLADPLDIIQGLESGADNFITKPYDAAYLTSRVRMMLDNKRLRQAGKLNVGVEILFLGRKFTITSDKEQILDLLISTFEDIVRSNRQLEQSRSALAEAKLKLQEYAVALEGRVRASQERYRALLETAPDAIVTTTSDHTIEVANSQTAQTFGYREADLEDMPLERLFPRTEDANKELWQKIESVADRTVLRSEAVALRSDGTQIPIDLTMSDVPAETGSARMLILRDATARKRSELVLRESERRLRQFFESLPYGILVTTGEGTTYYVNKVAKQLTALEWEGPISEELQNLHVYHPGTDARYEIDELPLFRALAGEAGVGDMELRVDGRVLQLEATWTPIFDAQGNVEYALHAFSDVTHRRQMEQQLRQSQKIDALGQLAGGIAHDFNNLLMAMKTFADLLSRRLGTDPKGAKYLGEINKAVDRASWLTAQLLAFGRKQAATRSVVDLNRIVRSLGDMLRGIVGETITLKLALAPELGHINANEGQLEQVLTNLVLNARDAMPNGGTLMIETANHQMSRGTPGIETAPGAYVALMVHDTGTGMDENTRVRMFEPFFTTKGHGKGTGLGLSSVHGIVKEHGGTIDVTSTMGVGTCFRVCLPRVDKPLSERPQADELRDLQGSETILVVENDDAIRESLSEVLRARGYKVLTAGDGEEGARTFNANAEKIGLVVSDVVMPICGGVEMASEIQKIKPDAEVIFMSGYSDRQIPQEKENVILLQKPFSPDVLLKRIRDRLNARSEAAQH